MLFFKKSSSQAAFPFDSGRFRLIPHEPDDVIKSKVTLPVDSGRFRPTLRLIPVTGASGVSSAASSSPTGGTGGGEGGGRGRGEEEVHTGRFDVGRRCRTFDYPTIEVRVTAGLN